MDREDWLATVHGVAELDMTEHTCTHTCTHTHTHTHTGLTDTNYVYNR